MTLELTGDELRRALAQGLAPGRRPLEIAGGTYVYSVEDTQRVLGEVTVGDEPVIGDRRYRVARTGVRPEAQHPVLVSKCVLWGLYHREVGCQSDKRAGKGRRVCCPVWLCDGHEGRVVKGKGSRTMGHNVSVVDWIEIPSENRLKSLYYASALHRDGETPVTQSAVVLQVGGHASRVEVLGDD